MMAKIIRNSFLTIIALGWLAISVESAEEGFIDLFNGKSLDGWSIQNGPANAFTVQNGTIYCSGQAHYPCWLRSGKKYENFDLRYEYRNDGWCNSAILFSAPEYGRNSRVGFEVQIDHFTDNQMPEVTSGAIFGVVPPIKNAEKPRGEWNQGRILFNWPILKVWLNGELVQDLNVEEHEELKYRFRQGYIGLQDAGYAVWFRNLRIKELPSKENWQVLFDGKSFDGWHREWEPDRSYIAEWSLRDGAMHATGGTSYMVTDGQWRDFELHCYVRAERYANGGIFFRWKHLVPRDRGYEVQIENVADSNNPTGSLYHVKRAILPRVESEQWFPMQIIVKDNTCVIRVNGETTVVYNDIDIVREGSISLQMHSNDVWIEWKDIRIKDLSAGQ